MRSFANSGKYFADSDRDNGDTCPFHQTQAKIRRYQSEEVVSLKLCIRISIQGWHAGAYGKPSSFSFETYWAHLDAVTPHHASPLLPVLRCSGISASFGTSLSMATPMNEGNLEWLSICQLGIMKRKDSKHASGRHLL